MQNNEIILNILNEIRQAPIDNDRGLVAAKENLYIQASIMYQT